MDCMPDDIVYERTHAMGSQTGRMSNCLYGCRESSTSVKVFRNFKDSGSIRPALLAEGIAGGALLAVRSNEAVVFYDWTTNKVCYCLQGLTLLCAI